jgi:5-methylcytosine-specific restriction endonuclease McrA
MATKKRNWIQKATTGCDTGYTRIMKITLTCKFCRKPFERFSAWVGRKSNQNGNYFCSRSCADAGKQRREKVMVSITCKHCGKQKSFRKGQERSTFCSRSCHGKFFKEAASRSATTYRKRDVEHRIWRRAVIERDLKCQRCGRTDVTLHAHHKESYSDNPELRYELSNGESLCTDCHVKEHPEMAYLIKARRKPTFIKLCPVCTGKFLSDKRATVHCSRKCSAFSKRIESGGLMLCEGCKQEFLGKPSRHNRARKFCSRRCSTKWFGITQGGRCGN